MSVEDVYLLMLHEPYASSEHPVPINATIVHALTLLHPAVPQPDGSRMYRCLTEFPSRARLPGPAVHSDFRARWRPAVAGDRGLEARRRCRRAPSAGQGM
jgi:hypothetical protein